MPARRKPKPKRLKKAKPTQTKPSGSRRAFIPAPVMREAPRKSRIVPYTKELGEEICQRIANGASGAEVCRDPEMPDWPTIARWRRDRKDFAALYAEAEKIRSSYWADQIVDIADNAQNDWIDRHLPRGGTVRVLDREHFERSRLRVASRQWLAGRLLREVYGERVGLEHSGKDGGPIGVKTETKNELIESIIAMIRPKPDGTEKPNKTKREARG